MLNDTVSTFPVLTTARLTLRQPAEGDVQELFLLRSNPEVNKYLDRRPAKTMEETSSFINQVNGTFKNNTGVYWAITQTGHEKLIGTICLYNLSGENKKGEIGYELLPGYQGRGMMHEAIKRIIHFAFQTLGLKTIEAVTHKNNHNSTKLLRKLHFEETTGFGDVPPSLILFRLYNQD